MNPSEHAQADQQHLSVAEREAIAARYTRLRGVIQALNETLPDRLSTAMIEEAARRLGLLQRGIVVLNSESELPVLIDYCLYDVRHHGRNTIEEYLLEAEPEPESDEMTVLRAMQHARYCLLYVESVIPGLGVRARDLFTDEMLLIADFGYSETAVEGTLVACRVLFHDRFAMTAGAGLPIGVIPGGKGNPIIRNLTEACAPEEGSLFDPAPIIRSCLRHDAASHVEYQDPHRAGGRARPGLGHGHVTSARISRNAPCPCGSGQKFKRCCMRRS
jgi:hypothetical protein